MSTTTTTRVGEAFAGFVQALHESFAAPMGEAVAAAKAGDFAPLRELRAALDALHDELAAIVAERHGRLSVSADDGLLAFVLDVAQDDAIHEASLTDPEYMPYTSITFDVATGERLRYATNDDVERAKVLGAGGAWIENGRAVSTTYHD